MEVDKNLKPTLFDGSEIVSVRHDWVAVDDILYSGNGIESSERLCFDWRLEERDRELIEAERSEAT